jgi:tRNA nucleotidyltransferase (CCA-adding enzyme)
MKQYLEKLPKEILDLIHLAQEVSCRQNIPAYLVGGFVRDLLLGVKNFDLDIVVEGDGIEFAQELSSILKAKILAHRRFGTATITIDHNFKIDITSARKEYYPAPAHLPVVQPGSLRDDLLRRDFTINAMAINIGCTDFGNLIDLFGGKRDLKQKKIRILHALSFIDDPTRILRAVRFEQRYNFKIEPGTLKELQEAVKLDMLQKVQPQRIRDELMLILKEERPLKQLKRLQALARFAFISEKLKPSANTFKLISSVENNIDDFKTIHHRHRHILPWLVYFSALADSLSVQETEQICRKFVFRKGEEKIILSSKKIKPEFIRRLSAKNIRPSVIYKLLEPFSFEAIIFMKAKYAGGVIREHIERFLASYSGTRIHISGHDLRDLGAMPGPGYQKTFDKILNARLDGLLVSKEEELVLARKLLKVR